uniref:Myb/SANT-like domain-containing protein n=1 Tax=Davidia involucrata TaxID=16924 RepID=A0A5B6Z1X7_DAVIN
MDNTTATSDLSKKRRTTKPKAQWDSTSREVFINLCVAEKLKGNMPTAHFNKKGWNAIILQFRNKTGKDYDRLQMKNHWDWLKKEWQLWKQLTRNETGLGWDSVKQTISASNEWWINKLEIIPEAAKFREKGLANKDELDQLFGDVAATGAHAFAPSSGVLPHMLADSPPASIDDDVYRPNMDNISMDSIPMDDSTSLTDDVDQISPTQREKIKKSGSRRGKRLSSDRLDDHLDRILSVVESTGATSKSPRPVAHISKDCMAVLRNMEGVESCGPLFMLGTRLFQDENKCYFFLNSLVNDEEHLAWLHQEHVRGM